MQRTKTNLIGGQKEGVSYLMQTYGLTYRKALSMFQKAAYQIAQHTDIHLSDTRAYNRFVAKSIEGKVQVQSNINIASQTVTIDNIVDNNDIFKSEVSVRLEKFLEKYKNTSIMDSYNLYMTNQISYEQLKIAIEDFKRKSYQYLIGS